jgi:2-polyprenyl-6-methoxyphenol hydroxylase-like FAD-dependent oxidoreductase
MSTTTRDRAVVLGGSVAGLLAVRVLADEYEAVTIVERDRLPRGSDHRRGVAQSHHVHALLPGGRAAAEELRPGLTSELVAAGALSGDLLQNVRWYYRGATPRKEPVGLIALSASRPLIEATIRRRALALPIVALLDGYDIVGLSSTVDSKGITGARVTSVHGEGSWILPAISSSTAVAAARERRGGSPSSATVRCRRTGCSSTWPTRPGCSPRPMSSSVRTWWWRPRATLDSCGEASCRASRAAASG